MVSGSRGSPVELGQDGRDHHSFIPLFVCFIPLFPSRRACENNNLGLVLDTMEKNHSSRSLFLISLSSLRTISTKTSHNYFIQHLCVCVCLLHLSLLPSECKSTPSGFNPFKTFSPLHVFSCQLNSMAVTVGCVCGLRGILGKEKTSSALTSRFDLCLTRCLLRQSTTATTAAAVFIKAVPAQGGRPAHIASGRIGGRVNGFEPAEVFRVSPFADVGLRPAAVTVLAEVFPSETFDL